MRKFPLVLANLSFAFSLIFILEGCAKKTPLVFEEEAAGPHQFEEETIGGVAANRSRRREGTMLLDEFQEVTGSADLGELESSKHLSMIHFDFGKHTIKREDRSALARNASWLKEHPEITVKIEGHCDERGTEDYNLALGDRRANAVKDYLLSFGIEPSRLKSTSFGEESPVCKEKTELCWSQNRRAEFFILKGKT